MAGSDRFVRTTDPINLIEYIDILSSQHSFLLSGFKTDLRKLQRIFPSRREVFRVPENMTGLTAELEDLLGQVYILLRELKFRSTRGKVRNFFLTINIYFKIKPIRKRLSALLAVISEDNPSHNYRMETTMMKIHSEDNFPIIGRDNDVRSIIDVLKQPSDAEELSVVSIVGTAGVGKSTLARLVYNDTTINEYFELKIWVNVSKDFDEIRLIKDVYTYVTDRKHIDPAFPVLQDHLVRALRDRKILLVLDNVNADKGAKVKALFTPIVPNGSKILVTTRSKIIASIISAGTTYNLEGLSDRHCISLFLKSAFGDGDQRTDHPESLRICNEIVGKSDGSPLAIRSLGTLLYQIDKSDGLSFISNHLLLEGERCDIIATLSFSYRQLPRVLQSCLEYCALFPNGYRFNSEYLIQCWMAARFLEPQNEIVELEDVGLLYCKSLIFRCFFQDVEYHGHYTTFKIHDLIHDFIIKEAQRWYSMVDLRHYPQVDTNIRHVSFINLLGNFSEVVGILEGLRQVETITFPILPLTRVDESFIKAGISKCKYLRFLCLNGLQFKKLPRSIGGLKFLTFLDLSWNFILEELSENICDLIKLETLLLLGCPHLKLPRNMGRMIRLRHLEVTADEEDLEVSRIAYISSLRYLHLHDCHRLQSLPLRSQSLTSLCTLILQDCPSLAALPDVTYPQTLEKLVINNCPLSSVLWPGLTVSLLALSYIRIEACHDLTELPPCLPDLTSLKKLEIVNCPGLSSLPDGMQQLTNLTQLKIQNCPILSESCRQNSLISHVQNIQLDPAVASSSRDNECSVVPAI